MNRRSAFKNLAIVAGGILVFPSCSEDKTKASIQLNKLDIDAAQENLLGEIAETIIPKTNTPGAKEIKVHLFVLKMMDDCYEADEQKKFISGLAQLDKEAKKRFNDPFVKCSAERRKELLESIEKDNDESGDMAFFYKTMKQRTIQGYMNSKYVMTNLVIYEFIPKVPYNGFAPA